MRRLPHVHQWSTRVQEITSYSLRIYSLAQFGTRHSKQQFVDERMHILLGLVCFETGSCIAQTGSELAM